MKAHLIKIVSAYNSEEDTIVLVYANNFTLAVLKLRNSYGEANYTFENLTIE